MPAWAGAAEELLPRAHAGGLQLNGKLDHPAWQAAAWTEAFQVGGHGSALWRCSAAVGCGIAPTWGLRTATASAPSPAGCPQDIMGPDHKPQPWFQTRVKMLWDATYLYVGAQLEEPMPFANNTLHDSVIFKDNGGQGREDQEKACLGTWQCSELVGSLGRAHRNGCLLKPAQHAAPICLQRCSAPGAPHPACWACPSAAARLLCPADFEVFIDPDGDNWMCECRVAGQQL